MGLNTYNKAIGLIKGDILRILLPLSGSVLIDSKALKRMLIRVFLKRRLWIWDSFEFSTMNVIQAISKESKNRVIQNSDSESSISVPGIGFTVISETSESGQYEIVVKDTNPQSVLASAIEEKFKIEPKKTENHDGVYYWYYNLNVSIT